MCRGKTERERERGVEEKERERMRGKRRERKRERELGGGKKRRGRPEREREREREGVPGHEEKRETRDTCTNILAILELHVHSYSIIDVLRVVHYRPRTFFERLLETV